ncbi:MAG: glycogen synthase GlgA [Pseudomonadota bacterium]
MKVLFSTSEAHPLAKTGGLADVSGALPAALRTLKVDARVLMPGYPAALEKTRKLARLFHLELPGHGEIALLQGMFPDSGVPVYLIEHPGYFAREGLYQDKSGQDWPDNAMRFGLLSQLAAWLAGPQSPLDFRPDILHCNDWQTGLAPAYLHFHQPRPTPSVFTIHNLAYQGVFPPEVLNALGLPPESFSINGVEYYGRLSFLKAGLFYASHLTTVSPNYAREIQTEAFGMGMQGLLASRSHDLTGILNGIDTREWNPLSDPYLPSHYGAANFNGKAANKRALRSELGLRQLAKTPLLGMVSRLTHQKGTDVVLDAAPRLLELGVQFAVLGGGEAELEAGWRRLAAMHPDRVAVSIGYDESLAHRIEAGADIFLMPSRFEPCGLNQMYSQRYGTPPLVHKVGGLADTVTHASAENLADGTATGFVIERLDVDTLIASLRDAIALYHNRPLWKKLMQNGMKRDFAWSASAQQYLGVYEKILSAK